MRPLIISVILSSLTAGATALAQPEPPPAAQPEPPPAQPADPPPPPDAPVVQMENTSAGQPAAPPVAPAAAATPPAVAPGPPPPPGAPADGPGEWKFDFHGYFRAPLRIGLGKRDDPADGQSSTTFHAPVIPDDQYLSWQYTSVNAKDWAELFFSYGNSWAKGTVGIQGFNFTDGAFNDGDAQFGIAQGWVTLTPDLGYENVRLQVNVGSFWSKYGMAGKYDSGKYDTYLFGRTHVLGEAVKIEIDIDKVTLWAEHGFGGKRPTPSIYNTAKFTLLNHIHAGASWDKTVALSLHHLHSWAQEEDRDGATITDLPDGSLGVLGGDLRLDGNMFGSLYFGYAHISASDARTVDSAIEVVHAKGGGDFTLGVTSNYLDGPTFASNGNGAVDTILVQYEWSLANLLENLKNPGSRFWGEGRDLSLALFGMWNSVTSDDPDMDGVKKLKFGADIIGGLFPWLSMALRFDRVQPNSRIPEQSFSIVSPRLMFRSQWVTHEEIQLQFSRYIYNQRTCDDPAQPQYCVQPPSAPVLPDGFGATSAGQPAGTRGAPTDRPDVNVFKIQASMWW